MNNTFRGIALVINNIEFQATNLQDNSTEIREEAQFDSIELDRVLNKLHFKVKLHCDKTRYQIIRLLEDEAAADHSDSDCFLCVVMSHGSMLSNGGLGVCGIDWQEIDIEVTAKSLFSNTKCPSLMNKPKLFFIDACWADAKMNQTGHSHLDQQSNIRMNSRGYNESYKNSVASANIPDLSDFLFSFSTLPSYPSFSDDNGNWFIQKLTSVLDEFGETRTLFDIMQKVRQELKQKNIPGCAQMSVDHWFLSHHVLFKSKEKKILCSSKANTYLLNFCLKRNNVYGNIEKMNTFELMPLLTRIAGSWKFASLSDDPRSVQVWHSKILTWEMFAIFDKANQTFFNKS